MPKPEQLPFQEAIDFWKVKVKLPSSGWTDVWQEQHSHAFVVAGASKDALVEDLYNAIQKAKQEGGGYEEFRQRFPEIAKQHGWAYNGAPGWRSKIIYTTNITQAHNAGRYQQMVAVKHLRPFWEYDHTTIEHPRLEHKAWDGLILPADDPWFDTHFPQNGWGCNCKIRSLTRTEAANKWTAAGKTGSDEAPPIEWETRTVGAKGSNPRTVEVPKGIDPGFAYNPGKAWLEPHTVPPLTGYDDVLKERGGVWQSNVPLPKAPVPKKIPASDILPKGMDPTKAVEDFLDVFGADLQHGAVFTDASGVPVAISKALFEDGSGSFKWLGAPEKEDRLRYINLMAETIADPDEIWWAWEQDRGEAGRWRLKRRYLKAFELDDGSGEYGISAFEWSSAGWTGSTVFLAEPSKAKARLKYFDRQRKGRLVFKK